MPDFTNSKPDPRAPEMIRHAAPANERLRAAVRDNDEVRALLASARLALSLLLVTLTPEHPLADRRVVDNLEANLKPFKGIEE